MLQLLQTHAQEEQTFSAQLCFHTTLAGHVTHPVTTYWNIISHQIRHATNSRSTTQEVPYPHPGPKYSAAVLPSAAHQHDTSSRGRWHSSNWEAGRDKTYILFIHVSHVWSLWLWGIPYYLHKNERRTKHWPRRVVLVCSRKEEGGEHHKHPTPHSTADRLEALANLLCKTYCSKMEEGEREREIRRTSLNSNDRDGGSQVKKLLGVEGFALKSWPHAWGHWNSSACHWLLCGYRAGKPLCLSFQTCEAGIWVFPLLQQGLLRLGVLRCAARSKDPNNITYLVLVHALFQCLEAWQVA